VIVVYDGVGRSLGPDRLRIGKDVAGVGAAA